MFVRYSDCPQDIANATNECTQLRYPCRKANHSALAARELNWPKRHLAIQRSIQRAPTTRAISLTRFWICRWHVHPHTNTQPVVRPPATNTPLPPLSARRFLRTRLLAGVFSFVLSANSCFTTITIATTYGARIQLLWLSVFLFFLFLFYLFHSSQFFILSNVKSCASLMSCATANCGVVICNENFISPPPFCSVVFSASTYIHTYVEV